MDCRLFGAKPLPETILTYCSLDPWEQTSVKFDTKLFIHGNAFEAVVCEWRPFCPVGDELINALHLVTISVRSLAFVLGWVGRVASASEFNHSIQWAINWKKNQILRIQPSLRLKPEFITEYLIKYLADALGPDPILRCGLANMRKSSWR